MNENEFLENEEDEFYDESNPGIEDDISPQDEDELDGVDDDDSTPEELEEQAEELEAPSTDYTKKLLKSYDDIIRLGTVNDAVQIIVERNPVNTNSVVIMNITRGILTNQGKGRFVIKYPNDIPSANDIDDDDSNSINEKIENDVKDLIWRFIKFLTERDLSKDNASNRRKKMRHIPALIIYLFNLKLYGLLIGCPYMPEDYSRQINNALSKINETKHNLVEELATMYEEAGRKELAEKVREMDTEFFDREPAELKTSVQLRNIEVTDADVIIYKSVRTRYINTSKSITQEAASDMIEVVVDKDAGIYEKLKDKVRFQAIDEVKTLLREFAESSPVDKDHDVVKSIIFR